MGKYREVRDLFSREERARTPVKGIRLRLRTAVRKLGIREKFRTDVLRGNLTSDHRLAIITDTKFDLPFDSFEGMKIIFIPRTR
jgi:hypothetical protein